MDDFVDFPDSPNCFHESLCRRIRQASHRVHLASLYVGPAADRHEYTKEVELLDAIGSVRETVNVQIWLDHNRALRQVPHADGSAVTSAQACRDAHPTAGIHLISVLPHFLQRSLPNPYNEVVGVFHIKAYIVDDEICLSGANLSEEYFVDRQDRYVWIQNKELVDLYVQLLRVLADHGVAYDASRVATRTTQHAMARRVLDVLTVSEKEAKLQDVDWSDPSIAAYGVPTFQAPRTFLPSATQKVLPSDVQGLEWLLDEADPSMTLRLASAYLNPTGSLQAAWKQLAAVHMLTAHRVSHGFRPKNKAGNKGKDWIPTVFEQTASLAVNRERMRRLWLYRRDNWSFHAKGLWLSKRRRDSQSLLLDTSDELFMTSHGSGNFGARSNYLDMESNLLLWLPPHSPLADTYRQEWNDMCAFAVDATKEDLGELDWYLRWAFPYIRTFF